MNRMFRRSRRPHHSRSSIATIGIALLTSITLTVTLATPAKAATVIGDFTFKGAPSGLSQITFNETIHEADPIDKYFWAYSFYFENQTGGYVGLQPTPDQNGKHVFQVLFSYFGQGATAEHNNCSSGADGGNGVTCNKLYVPAKYGHRYDLDVENTSGSTWKATITNTVTDDSWVIGSWTIPKDKGLLKPEGYYWNERYILGPCNFIGFPYFKVHFGKPTAENGKYQARLTNMDPSVSACPKGMTATKDNSGVTLEGGYK